MVYLEVNAKNTFFDHKKEKYEKDSIYDGFACFTLPGRLRHRTQKPKG